MEKLDKMGQKGQKGEKCATAPPSRRAQHPAPPKTARGVTVHARSTARGLLFMRAALRGLLFMRAATAPAAAPPRAQCVFTPFFTCSSPCDVMLTSLMTSAFPLRVLTFF